MYCNSYFFPRTPLTMSVPIRQGFPHCRWQHPSENLMTCSKSEVLRDVVFVPMLAPSLRPKNAINSQFKHINLWTFTDMNGPCFRSIHRCEQIREGAHASAGPCYNCCCELTAQCSSVQQYCAVRVLQCVCMCVVCLCFTLHIYVKDI